jgi:hypothetical protein
LNWLCPWGRLELGKVWDSKKIWLNLVCVCRLPMLGPATALIWPVHCPRPSPLIDYWMGITWFFPSHRLA